MSGRYVGPSALGCVARLLSQGVALGWYDGAPLALNSLGVWGRDLLILKCGVLILKCDLLILKCGFFVTKARGLRPQKCDVCARKWRFESDRLGFQ